MKERMIIKKNEQKFNSNILVDDIYYEGTIEDWCNITFSIFCLNPMKHAKHFYMKDNNNEYKEIKTIIIPNTITEIGDYQFHGFNNITSITIPNSVVSIGKSAFAECRSLDKIYYEGTLVDWCNITFNDSHSNPMFYGKHFYMKDSNNEYQEVKEIIIPDTIKKIGNYQFCGFNNVTSIVIPNSVESIDDSAFLFCPSLTIYCEAPSKPSGWHSNWNAADCKVVWKYNK